MNKFDLLTPLPHKTKSNYGNWAVYVDSNPLPYLFWTKEDAKQWISELNENQEE